jgi:hypothetical protein
VAKVKRVSLALIGALALAGCVSAPSATTPTRVTIPPPRYSVAGLESVIGQSAGALTRLFGEPDKDIREVGARKLQFVSPFCVLDAYLYPKDGGEPVVSHIDTRQTDGRDIDRASCVAAMQRRRGGK